MEQRMMLVENLINQIQTTVQAIQGSQTVAEAGHQQLHQEVSQLRRLAVEVERLKSEPAKRPGTYDKNLAPGTYAMDKSQWAAWSLKSRRYLNRLHPGLGAELLKVEGTTSPLIELRIGRSKRQPRRR